MRTLKYEAIETLQEGLFPQGAVEQDEDGQILIYTGLYGDRKPPAPTEPGLVVGKAHDCPSSPHSYCEYHDGEDPSHDSCVHCGDPYERK